MKKKTIAALFIVGVFALTACGTQKKTTGTGASGSAEEETEAETEEETAENTEEPASDTTEVTVVKVAAGSTYNPYCYIDENNNHTGFDVELLRAVDDIIPEYEFEIEATTINDLLLGLDSGSYALASHSLNKTPEREEKYLFSNVDTGYKNFWIISKADSGIENFEDLVGKTVLDKPGKSFYSYVEKYNEEHPDAVINIEGIDDLTTADRIQYIADGKYDASADNRVAFEKANEALQTDVEIKNLAFSAQTYFLYSQGQEALRDRVDEALKELKENGKLAEISNQFLGEDVTKDFSAE